jgi:hypothetical protein
MGEARGIKPVGYFDCPGGGQVANGSCPATSAARCAGVETTTEAVARLATNRWLPSRGRASASTAGIMVES